MSHDVDEPEDDTLDVIEGDVCAWCHRVRTEEGSWLPIGTFLRHARDVAMTHTICAPCAARAFGVTLRARA